jgi:AcrR family transcriptional regulator
VAARDGAAHLSLRGVATEAGYAPAALYGYFRNKSELLLALAADDLSSLTRRMREASQSGGKGLTAAATAALELLKNSETLAAMPGAFADDTRPDEAERHFNGRMIAALMALSEAVGGGSKSRDTQADTVLIAAALSGLALLSRSGRLEALGFTSEELLARLEQKFSQ